MVGCTVPQWIGFSDFQEATLYNTTPPQVEKSQKCSTIDKSVSEIDLRDAIIDSIDPTRLRQLTYRNEEILF